MIAQYLTPRGIANLMVCNRELYKTLHGNLIYDHTLGSSRNSVILWACQNGREDIVRAMLERNGEFGYRDWKDFDLVSAEPTSDLHLPLRFAAWYGHVEIIRVLLDWNIDTIRYDLRALRTAVTHGHTEAVRVLLEYSWKLPDENSHTVTSGEEFELEETMEPIEPLRSSTRRHDHPHGRFMDQAFITAVSDGQDEIIDILLADGRAHISLAAAARIGSERFVKLCCASQRPDTLTQDRISPLSVVAEQGHVGPLQILFDEGWSTNFRDREGKTPLCAAAGAGQDGIVRVLLDRKDVIPDIADNLGHTPLLEASQKGHVSIIEQLLNTGRVNVNSATSSGQSALSFVAGKGIEDAVRLLLSAGAQPDTRDHLGRSPLSLAAGSGFPAVVKLLLEADGVDPDSKCKQSQTPLAYAVLSGRFPGRVNGEKINPNDAKDEREMLAILQESLEDRMANCKIETEVAEDGAALSIMRELLADHRVDPNSRDSKGRSVLCLAILRGELAAVRLLLSSQRIDLKSKVYRNLTPVDLVKEKYKLKRLSEKRSKKENGV